MELYLKDNNLISEAQWIRIIDDLRRSEQKKALKLAILEAIKDRIPDKRCGVFFSGGIDSTFIAFLLKEFKADFMCYCVGLENSPDLVEAERYAKKYDLPLKTKKLTDKEAEEIIIKVKDIVGPDTMKVGVGSVVYAAAKLGKEDKVDYFFTGLGSEEIFAGYERHLNSKDINEECWQGLASMHQRDLVRDVALAENLKITLATPLLDKDVIIAAMQIKGENKIIDGIKKYPLRKIAEEQGLKDAWRPKKAAQYGSRFDHYMQKLAKKNGFKTKKEYLEAL